MPDDNAAELAKREDRAFGRKDNLHAMWQELALNFYSASADFTSERCLGEEYAIDQFDSEPERCRRDLADARSSMLRPEGNEWVKVQTRSKEVNEKDDVARTLGFINERLRYYLEEASFGFSRAEKEADNDIVVFGNSVKTAESEVDRYGKRNLVVRSWHLRDCAWLDDTTGITQDVMFRRFKASARHIQKKFPKAELHHDIRVALDGKNGGDPDREFNLCHIMMPSDEYDGYSSLPRAARKMPWVSLYYDSEHRMMLQESGSERFKYVVDRWMTLRGSQYGYSPSAMVSLPDGRSMQEMVRILIEASEKSLDPPMAARRSAIVSDIEMGGGGVTWIDQNYDEKRGPAIQPLIPEMRQVPIGVDLVNRTTLSLRDNWYLSKLRLPTQAKTAYETQALLEQFIRENLPLFGPWQAGEMKMVDEIFGVLNSKEMRGQAYRDHPMQDWPEDLVPRTEGAEPAELIYMLKNPVRDAIERNKVNQGQQALGMAAALEQVKPGTSKVILNVENIGRDMVRGAGSPAEWINSDDHVKQEMANQQQQSDIVGALSAAGQAADVAKTGTEAAANLQSIQGQAADSSYTYGPQ